MSPRASSRTREWPFHSWGRLRDLGWEMLGLPAQSRPAGQAPRWQGAGVQVRHAEYTGSVTIPERKFIRTRGCILVAHGGHRWPVTSAPRHGALDLSAPNGGHVRRVSNTGTRIDPLGRWGNADSPEDSATPARASAGSSARPTLLQRRRPCGGGSPTRYAAGTTTPTTTWFARRRTRELDEPERTSATRAFPVRLSSFSSL